jgi:hypothetical protein
MTAIPPAPGDDYPGQMQGGSPMTTFNTLRQTQAFPGEVLDVGDPNPWGPIPPPFRVQSPSFTSPLMYNTVLAEPFLQPTYTEELYVQDAYVIPQVIQQVTWSLVWSVTLDTYCFSLYLVRRVFPH